MEWNGIEWTKMQWNEPRNGWINEWVNDWSPDWLNDWMGWATHSQSQVFSKPVFHWATSLLSYLCSEVLLLSPILLLGVTAVTLRLASSSCRCAYIERQSCWFLRATFKKQATFEKWQEFLPPSKGYALVTKNCHFQGKEPFSPKNAQQVPCG